MVFIGNPELKAKWDATNNSSWDPGCFGSWRRKHNPSLWHPEKEGHGAWLKGMVRFRKGPGKEMLWLIVLRQGKGQKGCCEECPPGSRGELAKHSVNCQ